MTIAESGRAVTAGSDESANLSEINVAALGEQLGVEEIEAELTELTQTPLPYEDVLIGQLAASARGMLAVRPMGDPPRRGPSAGSAP
jgi:hypothetical protein